MFLWSRAQNGEENHVKLNFLLRNPSLLRPSKKGFAWRKVTPQKAGGIQRSVSSSVYLTMRPSAWALATLIFWDHFYNLPRYILPLHVRCVHRVMLSRILIASALYLTKRPWGFCCKKIYKQVIFHLKISSCWSFQWVS